MHNGRQKSMYKKISSNFLAGRILLVDVAVLRRIVLVE